MSLPPLRLLLPQSSRHTDLLPSSLLIQSVTPAAALLVPLLLHAQERDRALRDARLAGLADLTETPALPFEAQEPAQTLILNCYGTEAALSEAMMSGDDATATAFARFFGSDASRTGRLLHACSLIQIVQIDTLAALLGVLFVLANTRSTETTTAACDSPEAQIQDSQASSEADASISIEAGQAGCLVLLGLDVLLQNAGEYTGQGLARVAAACLDASQSPSRHVIFHVSALSNRTGETSMEIEEAGKVPLLTPSSALPATLLNPTVSVAEALWPFVKHSWQIELASGTTMEADERQVAGMCACSGLWRDQTGTTYRVTWQARREDGVCQDARYTRLDV